MVFHVIASRGFCWILQTPSPMGGFVETSLNHDCEVIQLFIDQPARSPGQAMRKSNEGMADSDQSDRQCFPS